MAQELNNKTALITGGTQGIGLDIARRFAEEGAQIVITGRTLEKAEKAAAALAQETGAAVFGCQADVSKGADAEAMMAFTLDKLKRIDILVCNAGITKDNLLLRMTEQDFDDVVATNLKGAFLSTKVACKPMLKARAGSIIYISSVVGLNGNPGQANYAATKAGLVGMAKSVAKELASRSIRCNVVAPGFIRTAMTDELTEEAKKALLSQIPLARFGEGREVAEACLYLASDRSAFVTGQVLRVDGGMMM